MSPPKSPLFKGEPVIVIHFGTDDTEEGLTLTACCGEKFEPDNTDSYRNIPRVLCTGCLMTTNRG